MLSPQEQEFIQQHAEAVPSDLALKFGGTWRRAIAQIAARQQIKEKLPTWWANPKLLFPERISLEQASSEITAKFKSSWLQGQKVLDLSSGMGIDAWAMAMAGKTLTCVEKDPQLSALTQQNHQVLGLDIRQVNGDGLAYAKAHWSEFDVLYADPSRRSDAGKKVHALQDYQPMLLEDIQLWAQEKQVMLKVSPLLDIQHTVQTLHGLSCVIVVCIKQEVKELLLIKDAKATMDPEVLVYAWDGDWQCLAKARMSEEAEVALQVSEVESYVYEPHPGLMKAGLFKWPCQWGLKKLAQHTHLYTSDVHFKEFPGRQYQVLDAGPYRLDWVKKACGSQVPTVRVRNFVDKAEALQQKLGKATTEQLCLMGYRDQSQKNRLALLKNLKPF